jgi:ubiquinone/menaquinone biosynthesis C-methylase UbiE
MAINEIKTRYAELANDECCLSCGGAAEKGSAREGETCIDLGSGRGTDVIRMAEEVGENGFVYGIDITPEMIQKGETTADKMGVDNVEFLQSPLEDIPLPDGIADLIISNCTINHSTNKKGVWKEIHRLLKPGGRCVVSDIYATKSVPEKYRNDPEAIAECWAGADTRETYLQTLEQSGFQSVEILEESKPYPKGEIEVCSFTIKVIKENKRCCCCGG